MFCFWWMNSVVLLSLKRGQLGFHTRQKPSLKKDSYWTYLNREVVIIHLWSQKSFHSQSLSTSVNVLYHWKSQRLLRYNSTLENKCKKLHHRHPKFITSSSSRLCYHTTSSFFPQLSLAPQSKLEISVWYRCIRNNKDDVIIDWFIKLLINYQKTVSHSHFPE